MTTRFQLGNRHLVEKRYSEALREFLAHAAEVPSEAPRAYVQAAECLRRHNTLSQPIEVEPGVVLVSAGDTAGAIELYRRALAVDADYFPALRGLAQALPADSEDQVLVLEAALRLRQDTLLVQMLGEHFERTGKPERARWAYERALQDHPNDRHLKAFLERVADAESSNLGAAQQEDAPDEGLI